MPGMAKRQTRPLRILCSKSSDHIQTKGPLLRIPQCSTKYARRYYSRKMPLYAESVNSLGYNLQGTSHPFRALHVQSNGAVSANPT